MSSARAVSSSKNESSQLADARKKAEEEAENVARLEEMRKRYDAEVKSWQQKAVPYHNYAPFGTWFERE